jgi:hypothetical protein
LQLPPFLHLTPIQPPLELYHPFTLLHKIYHHGPWISANLKKLLVTNSQGHPSQPDIMPKFCLSPIPYFVHCPHLKRCFTLCSPLQNWDPLTLEKKSLEPMYFLYISLHHTESSLFTIFQIHLVSKQSFILLLMTPKPPNSLGIVSVSHFGI